MQNKIHVFSTVLACTQGVVSRGQTFFSWGHRLEIISALFQGGT